MELYNNILNGGLIKTPKKSVKHSQNHPLWGSIIIDVPKEMLVINDKKNSLSYGKSLTKNNAISKKNKQPSIILKSKNILEPIIEQKGKLWTADQLENIYKQIEDKTKSKTNTKITHNKEKIKNYVEHIKQKLKNKNNAITLPSINEDIQEFNEEPTYEMFDTENYEIPIYEPMPIMNLKQDIKDQYKPLKIKNKYNVAENLLIQQYNTDMLHQIYQKYNPTIIKSDIIENIDENEIINNKKKTFFKYFTRKLK